LKKKKFKRELSSSFWVPINHQTLCASILFFFLNKSLHGLIRLIHLLSTLPQQQSSDNITPTTAFDTIVQRIVDQIDDLKVKFIELKILNKNSHIINIYKKIILVCCRSQVEKIYVLKLLIQLCQLLPHDLNNDGSSRGDKSNVRLVLHDKHGELLDYLRRVVKGVENGTGTTTIMQSARSGSTSTDRTSSSTGGCEADVARLARLVSPFFFFKFI
jgi:hypothetical protein